MTPSVEPSAEAGTASPARRSLWKYPVWLALSLAAPVVWESAIALAVDHSLGAFSGARAEFLLANGLIVLAVSAVIYALTNRWLLSQVLTLAAAGVLVLGHIGKLLMLNRPLHLRDVALARQVIALAPLLLRQLAVPLLALALLLAVAGWGLAWSARRRFWPAGRCERLALGSLGAAVVAGLVLWTRLVPPASNLAQILVADNWDERTYWSEKGLLLAMGLRFSTGMVSAPAGYSEAMIGGILAGATPRSPEPRAAGPDGGPVNIIVYLGEAFWDPTRLPLGFSRDPMPRLRELLKGPVAGDLLVPTYGGMTSQTEFEVLTGLSTLYLMPGVPAYSRFVNRPLPALPAVLKALGYTTSAVHAYHRWFWDRARVFPLLGIDAFHAMEEFAGAPTVGPFISDDALVDRVIEVSEASTPSFVMAISLVTHGPYDYAADVGHAVEVEGEVSDVSRGLITKYSNALLSADAAVGRLIDHFRSSGRRTLIVIFGDHLPLLGNSYEAYREVGYLNEANASEKIQLMFKTPVVLWANYDLPARRLDLRANFLAPTILEAAQLPESALFAFVKRLGETDPLLLEDADSPPIRAYRALEYDLLFGEQYALGLGPILRRTRAQSAAGGLAPAERLKRLQGTIPAPEILDFGPRQVTAGGAFAHQGGGGSGLWLKCANVSSGSVVRLRGDDLATVHGSGGLLTATVPRGSLATVGRYALTVFDPATHEESDPVYLEVEARPVMVTTAPPGKAPAPSVVAPPPPPPEIVAWGPRELVAGTAFNLQPDGSSAFWFEVRHAPPAIVVRLDGRPLATVLGADGLVSASLPPRSLPRTPGLHTLTLVDSGTDATVAEVNCSVTAPVKPRRRP
jgi:phosphoglycerol transferase MdoB-like AlkP superfamily enzyme